MNVNEVAVQEVDGRHIHMALGDAFELGTDVSAVLPFRSAAYLRAEALLNIYRSHVDFLRHCKIESAQCA